MIETTIVDHVNHPIALKIKALLDKQQRIQLNQMIIDDEENILQAISAKIRLKMILTTDKDRLLLKLRNVLPKGIPVIELSKRTGKKLFGGEKISRDFAIGEIPEPLTFETLAALKKDLVVLDNLSISGNIGAIIRTSVALNAGAIALLGGDQVDIYDRRVIRASRGFVFKIPILSLETNELISFCKQNDIKLLATTSHTDTSIEEIAEEQNQLAIVFGSEKEGCSETLFKAADIKAKIPLNPEVESLNVSVSVSIILYIRDLYYRSC